MILWLYIFSAFNFEKIYLTILNKNWDKVDFYQISLWRFYLLSKSTGFVTYILKYLRFLIIPNFLNMLDDWVL